MRIRPQTRTFAAGFFVGATIFWLAAFFLHKSGYIYIHTSDYSRELREFNLAMTTAQGDLVEFEEFLQGAQAAFEQARAAGTMPAPAGAKAMAEVLPQFYARNVDLLKKRSVTSVVLWKEDAYKILIQSEVCSAIALLRPHMIDPVRQRYPLFCRYFGVWNPEGRAL